MKYDYHIAVIGAGSGGLVVASGAAGLGAKVALIEGEKMGGDCLNYGCVPSKTFLRSAHVAALIHKSKTFGIEVDPPLVKMNQVMERVHSVIKSIEPHDSKERFEGLGVHVIEGFGKIQDSHTLSIGDKTITAKNIVISTGSNSFIPPIKGLSNVPYYTNKTIFDIKKSPKHLIVLGAGPIGSELGQGFSHLGSKVTIIDMAESLFTKDDPEVGPVMLQQFKQDDIAMELGASIIAVRYIKDVIHVDIRRNDIVTTIKGDTLLVALGRKPNTHNLNLDKVGVKTDKRGFIQTNDKLQTLVSNIYACGDVTGPYAFTHMAGYQASIVVQNTIFPVKRKTNYNNVPWVTYTYPEVAHVGLTEPNAIKRQIPYKKYFLPLIDNDRAKTEKDDIGFLKILTSPKGTVIGATMVGEKAGEQIGLANLAIIKKHKITAFASMIFPYPTELEIYQRAGLTALKENFKPWQQNLVKRIFLR